MRRTFTVPLEEQRNISLQKKEKINEDNTIENRPQVQEKEYRELKYVPKVVQKIRKQ